MKIGLTTPEMMSAGSEQQLQKALEDFEAEWKKETKGKSFYHLVINWEIPRNICDEVEQLYRSIGWTSAKCRTSSENGDRPGLTGLLLRTYQE